MAELATIARPYAEALFKAIAPQDAAAVAEQVNELGSIAADDSLRLFADNPKASTEQVFQLVSSVAKQAHGDGTKNLLRMLIENGRLAALPEIAAQFQARVNSRTGVSDATIYSAFPIDAAQLPGVVASLEARFNRKLNASVALAPELIGGIRVVVGDEVLDTSVQARLEQLKVALSA
jgi:F-type H+-transporting ATPase subunit delta